MLSSQMALPAMSSLNQAKQLPRCGAALAKPAFTKIKSLIDPSEIGAAPLLGLGGLVFVGHGRSDAKAITSAILLANQAISSGYMSAIKKEIKKSLG